MKIVHIEDLEAWQCLVNTLLSPVGIEIVHFDKLLPGIKYLKENSADLVLLDLELPDSSLYETMQRFFREVNSIPVVIISAFDLSEDQIRSYKEMGCEISAYISKLDMTALNLLQVCEEAINCYYPEHEKPQKVLHQLGCAKEILLQQAAVEDDLF